MRDAARSGDRFTRSESGSLVCDLEQQLTVDDVEPLLLVEMEMNRRPGLLQVSVLNEKEAVCGLARQHFEEDGAVAEGMLLIEPVVAIADAVKLAGDGAAGSAKARLCQPATGRAAADCKKVRRLMGSPEREVSSDFKVGAR